MDDQEAEIWNHKETAQKAFTANQQLQQYLTQRAQQLEDEIQEAERLLVSWARLIVEASC